MLSFNVYISKLKEDGTDFVEWKILEDVDVRLFNINHWQLVLSSLLKEAETNMTASLRISPFDNDDSPFIAYGKDGKPLPIQDYNLKK